MLISRCSCKVQRLSVAITWESTDTSGCWCDNAFLQNPVRQSIALRIQQLYLNSDLLPLDQSTSCRYRDVCAKSHVGLRDGQSDQIWIKDCQDVTPGVIEHCDINRERRGQKARNRPNSCEYLVQGYVSNMCMPSKSSLKIYNTNLVSEGLARWVITVHRAMSELLVRRLKGGWMGSRPSQGCTRRSKNAYALGNGCRIQLWHDSWNHSLWG